MGPADAATLGAVVAYSRFMVEVATNPEPAPEQSVPAAAASAVVGLASPTRVMPSRGDLFAELAQAGLAKKL